MRENNNNNKLNNTLIIVTWNTRTSIFIFILKFIFDYVYCIAAAGKITGMLLELSNQELLRLVCSPAALAERVAEASQLLEAASFTVSDC